MERFADKTVVIVGAASEIGEAVARRLQREGAVVVGVDLDEHAVGDESLSADFRDEAAVVATFDQIARSHAGIDVVYNNAGRMDPADGSILELDLETWRRQMDANLTTVVLSCKHAVPHLLRNDPPGGAIVSAASFLGSIGAATAPMAFSASKAAVIQLTRDLGVHLARSGVRVNSVSFGPIATDQQRRQLERTDDILPARLAHWPLRHPRRGRRRGRLPGERRCRVPHRPRPPARRGDHAGLHGAPPMIHRLLGQAVGYCT